MRIVKIPKGNGKFRTIYVPSKKQREELRKLIPEIADRARKAAKTQLAKDAVHGIHGTNAVTAAMAHVGYEWTASYDIKSCFDQVTVKKLRDANLPDSIIEEVTVDGAARQGLPTSPACANLALAALDRSILRSIEKKKVRVVYTRYVDDMTFSGNSKEDLKWVREVVPRMVAQCGWKLSKHKTQVQYASNGRRIVCGVAVDAHNVHPTRKSKRKLRAAKHQENKAQAAGLEEWCKLRTPKPATSRDHKSEFEKLAAFWGLKRTAASKLPDKGPDIDIGTECGVFSCSITGDPVMMLGMSTWTPGWTSCMRHPNGSHRRGTLFWAHLEGTRLAALYSNRTKTIAGVTRRVMICRALVHTLKGSRTLVYDKVYGDLEKAPVLRECLKKAGAISVSEARKKLRRAVVVGFGPRWKCYFDSLHSENVVADRGVWKGKNARRCYV